MRLWRVVGESTERGRFDSRVVGGLTPLVGRTEEIALLHRRWDHAKDGDGQLILLSAPAGFGKSRMTQAFRERLDDPSSYLLAIFWLSFSREQCVLSLHQAARMGRRHCPDGYWTPEARQAGSRFGKLSGSMEPKLPR